MKNRFEIKKRNIKNLSLAHCERVWARGLFIIFFMSVLFFNPSFAFEDCVIMTKGKLCNIKIQHNDVVDVFPMITISNEKNTLVVHPLKEGQTKISVTKNDKEKVIFDVNVTDEKTTISEVKGFETFTIDCPPGYYEYYFELDEPPLSNYANSGSRFDANSDMRLEEAQQYQNFIDNLEDPPVLRGEF